jgi:hypothetical protein
MYLVDTSLDGEDLDGYDGFTMLSNSMLFKHI